MLVGLDIPCSPLSSEGLLRRYISALQGLGNSRRKKIKTTLPPGVREEQKGEEGEECALHWLCSRIGWQWGNVTGQQPGLLAINSSQGPKRLTLTAWSRGSVSCVAVPHVVASIVNSLLFPAKPERQAPLSL